MVLNSSLYLFFPYIACSSNFSSHRNNRFVQFLAQLLKKFSHRPELLRNTKENHICLITGKFQPLR
jgi:L-fucose isomerase-like protein